jgi:hypothetical protein
MLQIILGLFGYVKVPKETIQLSILLETEIERKITVNKRMIENGDSYSGLYKDMNKDLQLKLDAQKSLTHFLRSGRLISYKKGEIK